MPFLINTHMQEFESRTGPSTDMGYLTYSTIYTRATLLVPKKNSHPSPDFKFPRQATTISPQRKKKTSSVILFSPSFFRLPRAPCQRIFCAQLASSAFPDTNASIRMESHFEGNLNVSFTRFPSLFLLFFAAKIFTIFPQDMLFLAPVYYTILYTTLAVLYNIRYVQLHSFLHHIVLHFRFAEGSER